MRKLLTITSAVALAIASSAAMAVTAQSGVFVTGGVGIGALKTPTNFPTGQGYSTKNYGFAWDAGLGYQQALNTNILVGLEFGYAQLGKSSFSSDATGGTTESFTNKAWQVLLSGTYLWNNGFNLFVNGGAARVKTDASGTYHGDSSTKTRPVIGFGAGYQFTQSIGANVAYEHMFGKDYSDANDLNTNSTTPATSSTLTLNLTYTFPMPASM